MKLKREYRIGTRRVKTELRDGLYEGGIKRDGVLTWGREANLGLVMDKNAVGMDLLLHEMIHSLSVEHDWEIPETVVEGLASHLVAFCRDNNLDLRDELTA